MGYNVNIQRLDINALIDIQGEQSDVADWMGGVLPPFPTRPNTATNSGRLNLYWIGATRWLLRTDIVQEEELLCSLRLSETPSAISAVAVSDTQQFFSINGPDAGEIISVVTPMDVDISVFPENGVSYTDICGIKGILMRQGKGFEISVERSFADMIEDYLLRI